MEPPKTDPQGVWRARRTRSMDVCIVFRGIVGMPTTGSCGGLLLRTAARVSENVATFGRMRILSTRSVRDFVVGGFLRSCPVDRLLVKKTPEIATIAPTTVAMSSTIYEQRERAAGSTVRVEGHAAPLP